MYYIIQHFEFSRVYGPSTYITMLLERPLSNTKVFYNILHAKCSRKIWNNFQRSKKIYWQNFFYWKLKLNYTYTPLRVQILIISCFEINVCKMEFIHSWNRTLTFWTPISIISLGITATSLLIWIFNYLQYYCRMIVV